MSDNKTGTIGWIDLTVDAADDIRDFYASVTGWQPEPVPMGKYSDYNMNAPGSGEAVAGICHREGVNAALPPAWLIYITVADVDMSAARCVELGGKVLLGPSAMGPKARYCVIQDPAGAFAALYGVKAE
jgi:predicted enzyme related to lactoylglutathione lyase